MRHDLPFKERTAERLMAIARDPRIKATHVSLLPASWGTLYEITRLTDKQFKLATDPGTGIIRADMRRRDLAPLLRPAKHGTEAETEPQRVYIPGPPVVTHIGYGLPVTADEAHRQREAESRAKEKAAQAIRDHGVEAAQRWAGLLKKYGKDAVTEIIKALERDGRDRATALIAAIGDDDLATQYVIDAKGSSLKRAGRHLGQRPAQVA